MNWKPNTETPPESDRVLLFFWESPPESDLAPYLTGVYKNGKYRYPDGFPIRTPDFWTEFEGPGHVRTKYIRWKEPDGMLIVIAPLKELSTHHAHAQDYSCFDDATGYQFYQGCIDEIMNNEKDAAFDAYQEIIDNQFSQDFWEGVVDIIEMDMPNE